MRSTTRFRTALLTFAAGLAAVAASDANSAPLSPALRCEVGKVTAVASYVACRLKADAKGLTRNLSPDFERCETKIAARFPQLELLAGDGICPSEDDLVDLRDRSDVFESEVAILLSGGTLPTPVCGDGTIDSGEQCDVGNVGGETCATRGFYNGSLACRAGCTFDTSACHSARFEATASTVLDHLTGLEWESKHNADGTANLSDAHDVDNGYTWAIGASNTTRSGTLYSDFLNKLNGVTDVTTITTSGCFAGHCDWRIPSIDELKTIAIASPACSSVPCIQDPLFVPTRSGRYWSDSSRNGAPTGAYFYDFSLGAAAADFKTTTYFARAVRTAP